MDEIVRRALREDGADSDITSGAVLPAGTRAKGKIITREAVVAAGLPVAEQAFRALDESVSFHARVAEGDRCEAGAVLAELQGLAAPMLAAERTALNFLQRMCGIATLTAEFVARLEGLKTKILDTRKTAPGLRLLDKYAVRMGGGQNHRFGLSDGILIKDNHLAVAGSIREAVAAAKGLGRPVEVEVQSLGQVEEALAAGADALLLDNMSLEELRAAVDFVAGRALTEASGGVTLDNVRQVAETGVDFISVGALTHSARAADIALDVAAAEP